MMTDVSNDLQFVLDSGLRTILYYGNLDWVMPSAGGLELADSLNWAHDKAFRNAEFENFTTHGDSVGRVKKQDNLEFVEVWGTGHFVTADKPDVGLQILTRVMNAANF
jgi:cathepsin A (carboxypeptidase C)